MQIIDTPFIPQMTHSVTVLSVVVLTFYEYDKVRLCLFHYEIQQNKLNSYGRHRSLVDVVYSHLGQYCLRPVALGDIF